MDTFTDECIIILQKKKRLAKVTDQLKFLKTRTVPTDNQVDQIIDLQSERNAIMDTLELVL